MTNGDTGLDALVDELARVLHDADQAREVARRAGFPAEDLPAFDTASVFWSRVVRAADVGKTLGGVGAIVERAKAKFPGNRFFAAHGGSVLLTGGSSDEPSPPLTAEDDRLEAGARRAATPDTIADPPADELMLAVNAIITAMQTSDPLGWGSRAADDSQRELVDAALDALPLDDLRHLASKVADRGKPKSLVETAELDATVAAIARRLENDLRLDPNNVRIVQNLLVFQLDALYEPEPSLSFLYPYTRRDNDEWFATAWTLSLHVPVPAGVDPSKDPWRFPGWVDALSLSDVPHPFPTSFVQPYGARVGVRRLIELAPRVIAKLGSGPLRGQVPRLLLPAMFLDEAFHERLEPSHLFAMGGTWEERFLAWKLFRLPLENARRVANRIWELAGADMTEQQVDSVTARVRKIRLRLPELADVVLEAVEPAQIEATARSRGLLGPHHESSSELSGLSTEQRHAALRGWHQRDRNDPQAFFEVRELSQRFDLEDLDVVVELAQGSPRDLAPELTMAVWRLSAQRALEETRLALDRDLPALEGWFFTAPGEHLGALLDALEQTGRRPGWLERWAHRRALDRGDVAERMYAITRGRMDWSDSAAGATSTKPTAAQKEQAPNGPTPASAASASGTTRPEPQPSQAIDNRGAAVTQQIIVHGDAVFGPMTVGLPARSEALPSAEGGSAVAPNPVAKQLEDAYARRETLLVAGQATTDVDAEILELRRALRRGPTLHPGEYLGDGRFRLIEVIGRGGFALVWKAYDTKERRLVAVKVLHGELAREESRRERLFRGAKRMAELPHPNVVRVLVPEGQDDGFHYFVMELVPGGDLHRAIVDRKLDVDRALTVIESIADALATAHASGLVHRDVKPENILLREDGSPVLGDFDLVQARDTTGGTRTTAMGSVIYAAPEQSMDASRVDHRADVYGLGMTAVFCVHGNKLPMTAMFNRDAFLSALGCTSQVRGVLRRAVALEPEERFESMSSFQKALATSRREGADGYSRVEVNAPSEEPSSTGARPEATPERDPRAAPLETKVVHGVGLVLVPGGRFMMGAPKGEQGRAPHEPPQHEVELASFWLARTPVTNAQYREYMKANQGVQEPRHWGDRRYNQDEQPVVGVSWYETQGYCEWAGLVLPTEAQWEYACRAGTRTRYYSGDMEEDLKRVGWYSGNSGGRLHAVAELEPNTWGLYDMHGNVYEWCEDADDDYATEPRAGDGLRHEPVGVAYRVVRGGYFADEARLARSAYRSGSGPGARDIYVGFRPAQGYP